MAAMLIEAPPYGTPEWVAWRDHGLGASDLPTLAGCNAYQTEYQLACLKRGLTPAFEGNAATRWGHRIEAVGIEVYQETTGHHVVTGETFGDPRYPHLWATLDGRDPGDRVGVEVKWTAKWTEVPLHVEVQAQGQMGLADLDAVDVVRLSPYGEPTIHRITRDQALIDDLLALGEEWFARYVLGDEMPPLDGSPEALAYAQKDGPISFPADEQQTWLVGELRRTRKALARMTATEDELIRQIKESMVGGGLMTGPGFRVRWTPVKGRRSTAWKDLAAAAQRHVDAAVWDELLREHTKQGEPTTRFAPEWDDEETNDGD